MSADRPNIILITSDQQRFDTVAPWAPSFMRTPHYDILRREGVHFTSAYADCPLCVPVRTSIMTGKSSLNHGCFWNGPTNGYFGDDATLPSLLHDAGYQTAAIGKMHFGPQRKRHGFGEMIIPEDYYREMASSGFPYQPMHHGMGQNELYPALATVPENLTITNWTADQCVRYIRDRRDPTIPFFLWCSFTKPHPPLDPPEPYFSMYRSLPVPPPVYGDWSGDNCPEIIKRERENWSQDLIPPEIIKEARAAYLGLVTQVDYNMGRVFAALQDMGLWDDALILYCSDHGDYLGDHHCGSKSFFHEPVSHVPFVMRLPKSWKDRRHGSVVDSVVTHADILPTLVGVAGGSLPPEVDGQDLISLSRHTLDRPREFLEGTVKDYHRGEGDHYYFALTDGKWKYIWYVEQGQEQLFDLTSDPKEERNLALLPEFSEKRTEMYEELCRRGAARGSDYVRDGRMVSLPVVKPWTEGETTQDRRNRFWPGLHTEFYEVDVRH